MLNTTECMIRHKRRDSTLKCFWQMEVRELQLMWQKPGDVRLTILSHNHSRLNSIVQLEKEYLSQTENNQ